MKYANLFMLKHLHDILFSVLNLSRSVGDMWPTFFKIQSDFLQHVDIFTYKSTILASLSKHNHKGKIRKSSKQNKESLFSYSSVQQIEW